MVWPTKKQMSNNGRPFFFCPLVCVPWMKKKKKSAPCQTNEQRTKYKFMAMPMGVSFAQAPDRATPFALTARARGSPLSANNAHRPKEETKQKDHKKPHL